MSKVEDFKDELASLLQKYNAEVTVRVEWNGACWAYIADGIDVEFNEISDEEGNIIDGFDILSLPLTITGDLK